MEDLPASKYVVFTIFSKGQHQLFFGFQIPPEIGIKQSRQTQNIGNETMDGHDSQDPKQSSTDMAAFVQNLLQQMQSRFQTMSDSIVTKIDDMGTRINELEQSINDLRAEMGVEGSPSPVAPSKQTPEEGKPEEGSAQN